MINMLRDKISNFIHKDTIDQNKLLDTIYTSVLLVENDYKNAVTNIKNKTKKEHFLTLLIDISTKLIRYRLDNEKLVESFKNLMELMDVDVIYISKFKNNIFKKVLVWPRKKCKCVKVNEELSIEQIPFIYNSITTSGKFIKNGGKFSESDQCLMDENGKFGECIFPITIGERIWGLLGFIRYDEDCNWNDEHINICNVLSTIFSSHIKTYKLIDDLKQGSEITDITNTMARLNTWSKDEFGKFTYCSPCWKKTFFGFDNDVNVIGKTNIELISDITKNTFASKCVISDDHCMNQNRICYYIELGYINNRQMVFGVKKSPVYFDNRYRGIVGISEQINIKSSDMIKILSNMGSNTVECLNIEDDIKIYWLKTEDIYNSVFEEII